MLVKTGNYPSIWMRRAALRSSISGGAVATIAAPARKIMTPPPELLRLENKCRITFIFGPEDTWPEPLNDLFLHRTTLYTEYPGLLEAFFTRGVRIPPTHTVALDLFIQLSGSFALGLEALLEAVVAEPEYADLVELSARRTEGAGFLLWAATALCKDREDIMGQMLDAYWCARKDVHMLACIKEGRLEVDWVDVLGI
ncbi:hypothetical protein BDY21DRAFT_382335 [Lineolata rhizophorae]|uniref:Uncharacterized protein n=1 Tax=Lineolata rhizophorae TaxID=578093 RepID=A0A6A6NN94_9PEZI|nr:hypothetical protein BDY21DRAFT_382335 [Lineolata rhizophorae]